MAQLSVPLSYLILNLLNHNLKVFTSPLSLLNMEVWVSNIIKQLFQLIKSKTLTLMRLKRIKIKIEKLLQKHNQVYKKLRKHKK